MSDSDRPTSVKREALRLDAYGDYLAIICITILTGMKVVPWLEGLGAIVLIGAGIGLAKARGKQISVTGLAILATKKALGIAVISSIVFLSSCASLPTGQAISTMLPVAAEALKALAAKEGATIDESGAVCYEVPDVSLDEFEGLDVIAIICVAATLEQ